MRSVTGARIQIGEIIRSETLWNISLTLLTAGVFAAVFSRTTADPDLWGHLRFGLDILHSGSVTRVDPYSYLTAGQVWINHEWLAELLFGVAWTAAGVSGLNLLKLVVGILTVGAIYIHFLRQGMNYFWAVILTLSSALLLVSYLFHIRPQMFTYLFFTLVLLLIYRAERGEYRWLWLAPFCMVLWTNLHGGFLAGMGILALWMAAHLLINRKDWRKVIPPVLLSLATVLVNPYGLGLITFLLRTATVARPEIEDWQPLQIASLFGLFYLLVLGISTAGLVMSQKKRCLPLIMLFGVTALLPLLAVRHLPLFSIAALVLAGEHIESAWSRFRPEQAQVRRLPAWATSLPVLVAVLALFGFSSLNIPVIQMKDTPDLPFGAVALLKQSGASGNLATEFGWGEYIIWHLGPRVRVSIDGRRETIYPEEIYNQSFQFINGEENWDALLEEHPTDMALVNPGGAAYDLLKLTSDWLLVYQDSNSALFVRQEFYMTGQIQAAAVSFSPSPQSYSFP